MPPSICNEVNVVLCTEYSKGNQMFSNQLVTLIVSILLEPTYNQGGGEHVAAIDFTHQGSFVACLTKDERLVLLTGTGMLLREPPYMMST